MVEITELKTFIETELENSKITDLQILDVSAKTSLTHYIFIGTANSNRQVDSTANQ